MSADVERLLAEARAPGERGERAAARLASKGARAVAPALDALGSASPELEPRLARVVLRIRAPAALRALRRYVGDENPVVALTALAAVGRSRDPAALDVLKGALGHVVDRRAVLEAIGELRDRRGLDVLRREAAGLLERADDPRAVSRLAARARQDGDTTDPRALVAIAVALGKLGDPSLCGAACALSRFGRSEADPDGDALVVRLDAIVALALLVGRGVFRALAEALDDESGEVRRNAMRALLLLGNKRAVPAWIASVRSGGDEAPLAHSMIHELVGEWPGGEELLENVDPARLERWWRQRERRFDPAVCYRFGRPASPRDLLPLVDRGASDDLRIITGIDFQLDADLALLAAGAPEAATMTAARWWQTARRRFRRGRLYKYARSQPLEVALRP